MDLSVLQVLFLVTGPVACLLARGYPWTGAAYLLAVLLLWMMRVRGFRTIWVPWNWSGLLPVAGGGVLWLLQPATSGESCALLAYVLVAAATWVGSRGAGYLVATSGVAAVLLVPGDLSRGFGLITFAVCLAVAVYVSHRKQPPLEDVSHLGQHFGPLQIQLLSYGLKRLLAVGIARRVLGRRLLTAEKTDGEENL